MAIIDSAGLFLGDRLGWCSDVAQLHWPRLYSAANNFARLELNYRKILSKAYANFRTPPAEQEFWAMIREYKDNFLLLVYQTDDGVLWGQWQTNERYLLGHKNADDRRSPAPPLDAQDAYRNAYLDRKKSKSSTNVGLADLLGVVPSCSGSCDLPELTVAGVGVGVGVGGGEGVGGGKEPSPPMAEGESPAKKTPDPRRAKKKQREVQAKPPCKTDIAKFRHKEFKAAIGLYWKSKNPAVEMPWGAPEGQALEIWLRESPTTTIEQFTGYLRNRFKSDANHTDRPSLWIRNITSYATEPLNKFRQPQSMNGANTHVKPERSEQILTGAQRLDEKLRSQAVGQPALSSSGVDETEPAIGRLCS